MFCPGKILRDQDHDFLPDDVALRFVLPKNPSASILTAACNIAFRLGMETTAFSGSFLREGEQGDNVLIFEESESCVLKLEESDRQGEQNSALGFRVTGFGEELEEFTAEICNQFPFTRNNLSAVEALYRLEQHFNIQTFEGELAFLIKENIENQAFLSNTDIPREQILERYPNLQIDFFRKKELKIEKRFDLSWELDDLDHELDKLLDQLREEDVLKLRMAVSESPQIREQLARQIERRVNKKTAQGEISVLCSYKQGFSWIAEELLPRLRALDLENADVHIAFKPFLPEGVTEFKEESGAVPTYGASTDRCGQWLDLPIRPLQELYPIADILERELKFSRDQIIFEQLGEDCSEDYRLTVKRSEDILFQERLCFRVNERLYLSEYKELGLVHPPTGYLDAQIVRGNDKVAEVNRRIESDVEKIWEIFQSEILPEVKRYLLEKYGGKLSAEKQPYFAELRLCIEASEPNYSLGIREDMISSLDVLHEDLYFTTIEYLKCVGLEYGNAVVDAPGLIYPEIVEKEGAPSIRFELYDYLSDKAFYVQDEKKIEIPSHRDASCFIEELLWDDGIVAVVRVEGADEELVGAYAELLREGLTDNVFGDCSILLRCGDSEFFVKKASAEKTDPISISEVDLSEGKLIGYEEYLEIIGQLKRVKELSVNKIAKSFEGRAIYAVELRPSAKGYVSRVKRLSLYPSLMINARHHANEVSSTNEAFLLIRELLIDPRYRHAADRLCILIIPMENVDGVAIHYRLQQDNPNWILHTARFNAIGKEFGRDLFDPNTISTEALAQSRAWKKSLPDIYVDNHGVPSHEWAQPFSGYTAPAYKGFWLPRSILYGYFWTIEDARYSQNDAVNKKMEDMIADSISQDPEIFSKNTDWIWQFENYAHRWMPKQYPADYYKNMINYWIPFGYDPTHKYMSIRYPWITTVAYTSEVADETAHGDYLRLCTKAHLLHDLATLDLMLEAQHLFEQEFVIGEEGMSLRLNRSRPLCFI